MQNPTQVIVGGGISGLLTAYLLKRLGQKPLVLEATARVGGWLQTELLDDQIVEYGPNSILADEEMLELFEDLGLCLIEKNPALKNRYIWKSEQRLKLPLSPLSLLITNLFSCSAKFSILTEIFRRTKFDSTQDPSISEFFKERFHSDILNYAVDPFVSGVFAGDVHRLSFSACFPELWDEFLKRESVLKAAISSFPVKRKKMISFKGGMSDFIRALESQLEGHIQTEQMVLGLESNAQNWTVKTSSQVFETERLILALPSKAAASLLRSQLPASDLEFLSGIPYQDILVWHVLWERPENFSSGLGCLVPRIESKALRGSLWPSEIFPGRYRPSVLLSTQYYAGEDIGVDLKKEEIFLQKLLGISKRPLAQESRQLRAAIPQYESGHREAVKQLRSRLPKSLQLVGNYLDGVGLTGVMKAIRHLLA